MTIPFGRRRLILTVALTSAPARFREPQRAAGADDQELVRLSRQPDVDIDLARWEGLSILYGASRRR
jgi:hypothetical protein